MDDRRHGRPWDCPRFAVRLIDGADEEDSLDALYAGARAILPRSAEPNEIVSAIKAVIKGFAVLPHELLATLLNGTSATEELPDGNDEVRARLTPRELEVLAAMADGVSNKASHAGWESPSTPPSFTLPRFSPSSMRTAGPKR